MTNTEGSAEKRLLHRIGAMVDDEKRLRGELQRGGTDETRARLRAVEVELDQCWDLLRQRRALKESGGDPGTAQVRTADEVEGYLS